MAKNIIIAVLSVLVLVLGFFALNYFIYYEKQGGMGGAMHDMTAELEGKTGDELDRAFLEGMIVHHEGAVAMAEAVRENGAHPELKVMADAIIAAQSAEIAEMKSWLSDWYGSTEHTGHTN